MKVSILTISMLFASILHGLSDPPPLSSGINSRDAIFSLNGGYEIHGVVDSTYKDSSALISSFKLVDRYNKDLTDQFCCLKGRGFEICRPFLIKVKRDVDVVTISHILDLPTGSNWFINESPIIEQVLDFSTGKIIEISNQCVFRPNRENEHEFERLVKEYQLKRGEFKLESQEDFDNFMSLLSKLFVGAASGDQDCQREFLSIHNDFSMDDLGFINEIHETYRLILNNCK